MGLKYPIEEHVGKCMMVKTFECNIKDKLFVAQWVVQTEKDTHKLGIVEDHMSPWSVAKKGRCDCWLMLKLQEGNMLINHKPNNHD